MPDSIGPLSPAEMSVTTELVRRSKDGDEAALNDLLERYRDRILRTVRLRMGPRLRLGFESVDLVQETLFAASRSMDQFEMREPAALFHWLSKIAENRIRDSADWLGAAKRDPAHELQGASVHLAQPDLDSPGPDESASQRELEEKLDLCVASLPHDWTEVIRLRDYESGSWAFVAEKMGRTVRSVESLHARALRALTARFGNEVDLGALD